MAVDRPLKDLAGVDELRAMTDAAEHRGHNIGLRGPSGALAEQPDQRRAIAVVGLEPPRAQLRPRRRRF
jgi:hypothetical protein